MSESNRAGSGLSWTGIAALYVILRLLAVAHYDWHTGFSVVDSIDLDAAASVALGTFMADELIGGIALAVLLALAVVRQVRMRKEGRPVVAGLAWLAALVVFVISHMWTFHSWWLLVVAAGLSAVLWWRLRTRFTRAGREAVHATLGRFGIAMSCVVLIVAATVTTPWVPLERIRTDRGVVTGYVIDTQPGFLKILVDDPRELRTMTTGAVVSRTEL